MPKLVDMQVSFMNPKCAGETQTRTLWMWARVELLCKEYTEPLQTCK